MLGLKYELRESKREGFIEGRTGGIIVNKKECGFIGEAHPETLKYWNIKMPISLLEIDLSEIFQKDSH